jgi:acyl-CoA reductase-like NAD-dependent aldehyde dehydrogenase
VSATATAPAERAARDFAAPEVPFGGFGESGLGRELGAHALSASTELKSVFLAT